MFKQSISTLLMVPFFTMLMLGSSPSSATSTSATTTSLAFHLGLDGSEQGDYLLPGDVVEYALDVPSPGILALEVMASGVASEPDLRLSAWEGSPWVLLERAVNRWSLAVLSAGTLYLEVSAQDTRQALGSYRVISRFAPATEDLAVDFSGTRLEEVNPNPGGLTTGPKAAWALRTSAEDSGSRPRLADLPGLCGKGDDDHEDSFACATTLHLGRWMDGRFDVGQEGDDIDVFTFTLDDYSAMDIVTNGLGKVASLYDDEGQRLAFESWTEEASWQKTLSPGRYFIVLEGGSGADEAYQLRARVR